MSLFRKAGGGFLNGVSGLITGLKFDIKQWPAQGKKKAYATLSAELNVRQDGATEDVKTFLGAGFAYDDWTVDGATLASATEGFMIGENNEFAGFITSIIANGGDVINEAAFSDDGRDYTPVIGLRVTFAKIADEEGQLAAGKKALGAKAASATVDELMAAGKRKDKKDAKKSYNRDFLTVSAVLGRGTVTGAAKTVKAASTKTTKPAQAVAGEGVDSAAFLANIVAEAAPDAIEVGKLSTIIVKYALTNNITKDVREVHRKAILADGFIASQQGWSYDAAAKTISLG